MLRILALIFACLGAAAAAESARPRVLIVDGINNHDWAPTTAWLQKFLTASGRFAVDVSTTPAKDAPAAAWDAWRPKFSDYAVVLSNFNGGHQANGAAWPAEVEKSFENYVHDGGGFVSFHAANNAFGSWVAYNEMIGLGWREKTYGPSIIVDENEKIVIVPTGEGRGPGHPPRYTFQMSTLETGHPITAGFPKRWMHPSEQLSHGQHGLEAVVRSGALTILTYAWSEKIQEREPMDWVRNYGQGRVYVTMLGHTWKNEEPNNPNLHCAGFQTLFLRGVEWAATGKVTVPLPDDFPTADKVSVRAD